MAFTSYLIKKFDFTHENEFFRRFSDYLSKEFSKTPGAHVLIGNISVNGYALDAIFICHGQISVIDFKNYSGTLFFSENNPWVLQTKLGKEVFVQGGAKSRNPYQQVSTYRRALYDFLQAKEDQILLGVRSNINWNFTSGIVLFQGKISYDPDRVPDHVKNWFHISDSVGILNLLKDKNSPGLNFTDQEIEKILTALDVNEENLTDHIIPPAKSLKSSIDKAPAAKLSFIKKALKDTTNLPPFSRILTYFRTLAQIERYNNPQASTPFSIPFDLKKDLSIYPVSLTENPHFHALWLENVGVSSPKALFIGVAIDLNGLTLPALFTCISASDVQNHSTVLNLNKFELYTGSLEQMDLAEDIIDTLFTEINNADTLLEKLEVFRNNISDKVKLSPNLIVSLSDETRYTLQLQSELKALSSQKPEDNPVFTSFLFQEDKTDEVQSLELTPLVQVTRLNKSQRKAIELSFKQNLTVIQGPPGSGKSQVVTNILANALVNDYSVLFVSNNNLAVDNVKSRLDSVLDEKVFIRFGAKAEVEDKTIPTLKSYLTRKSAGSFFEAAASYNTIKHIVVEKEKRISFLHSEIAKIAKLEEAIKENALALQKTTSVYSAWIQSIPHEHKKLFIDQGLTVDLNFSETALKLKTVQEANQSWFSRLLFRFFNKEKVVAFTTELNNSFSLPIIEYIRTNAPYVSLEVDLTDSLQNNLLFIIQLHETQRSIALKEREFQQEITRLTSLINELEAKLNQLRASKPNYESEIDAIHDELPHLGVELMNAKVAHNLYHLDTNECAKYVDSLPGYKINTSQGKKDFAKHSKEFLKTFKIVSTTNLSIKNAFPLWPELFDLVVIDEASQCDLAAALPLIFRAKKAVIIGDPNQLKHISSVKGYEEDFILDSLDLNNIVNRFHNYSLFDYANDLSHKCRLETVFLEEHFRCHPEIISFSNQQFYENAMVIATQAASFTLGKPGFNWKSIKGTFASNNTNIPEANACIKLAFQLHQAFPQASIGIITPFANQARYISDSIPAEAKTAIKVATVHRYQGDERDIMILSLVITQGSPATKMRFINSNGYLLNVAVTRARHSLFVVGDYDYCNNSPRKSPLNGLTSYAKELDKVAYN